MIRNSLIGLLAALSLGSGVALAADKMPKEKPDATLHLETTSVAVGVGYSWGKGMLAYKGRKYPVEISGLSAADVGAKKASVIGEVFHLKHLKDFNGKYAGVGAGAAVGGGAAVESIKNQNGVLIQLHSTSEGIQFTLGGTGADIKLKGK